MLYCFQEIAKKKCVLGSVLLNKGLRFSTHTHNFNTKKWFGEDRPKLKPPSGVASGRGTKGDVFAIRQFISGVVFDNESELVWIYKSKQSFFGKMNSETFFKIFDNE
jgi:hypothetical protein